MVRLAVLLTPPCDAVIVAVAFRLDCTVEILKLAETLPAGIVTVAGTLARVGLLLDNVTTAPPAGAGAVRATVPTETAPPTTEVGLSVKEVKVAAVSVITVDVVTPL